MHRSIFDHRSSAHCDAPAGIDSREVTRVEISSRQDVLGGKLSARLVRTKSLLGRVYFAVAPENPHNQFIATSQGASEQQGKVEFSARPVHPRPKDPAHGNGVLFFDVVNRGTRSYCNFNHASGSADPTTRRIR